MKISKLNIEMFAFFGIVSLLFLNYDLFVATALIYILFLFFVKYEIEVTTIFKILTYICVFLFFTVVRLLPIINKSYLPIWNRIAQQNYLIGDGYFLSEDIFLDLQLTLFSMSCNTNQLTYKIRYSSDYLDTKILTCPYETPYGYILNFITITENIWQSTVTVGTILLFLFFLVYLDIVKDFEGKKFILSTLLFLSPPINFLLFRLNIDIFIFFMVYIFIFKLGDKFFIRTMALFGATLVKFYTIAIIFFDLVNNTLSKRYRYSLISATAFAVSISYLLFFDSNTNFLDWFNRPIESNLNFGIFNDALYLSQIFGVSWFITFCFLSLLILGFIFIIPEAKISHNLNENELSIVTLFLTMAVFSNFDYRLVFLMLLIKPFLFKKINLSFVSMTIFMYTSPSLLHAYENYYKIVRNDEIFFLDFSFYFFIAVCLKTLWAKLIKSRFSSTN